ncbi:MAG: hypothetical protein WAV40_00775 [Microgenomates group bacterium]
MEKDTNSINTTLSGLEAFLANGSDLDFLLNAVLQQKTEPANFQCTLKAWEMFLKNHKGSKDSRFARGILAELDLKLQNALNPKDD